MFTLSCYTSNGGNNHIHFSLSLFSDEEETFREIRAFGCPDSSFLSDLVLHSLPHHHLLLLLFRSFQRTAAAALHLTIPYLPFEIGKIIVLF